MTGRPGLFPVGGGALPEPLFSGLKGHTKIPVKVPPALLLGAWGGGILPLKDGIIGGGALPDLGDLPLPESLGDAFAGGAPLGDAFAGGAPNT